MGPSDVIDYCMRSLRADAQAYGYTKGDAKAIAVAGLDDAAEWAGTKARLATLGRAMVPTASAAFAAVVARGAAVMVPMTLATFTAAAMAMVSSAAMARRPRLGAMPSRATMMAVAAMATLARAVLLHLHALVLGTRAWR